MDGSEIQEMSANGSQLSRNAPLTPYEIDELISTTPKTQSIRERVAAAFLDERCVHSNTSYSDIFHGAEVVDLRIVKAAFKSHPESIQLDIRTLVLAKRANGWTEIYMGDELFELLERNDPESSFKGSYPALNKHLTEQLREASMPISFGATVIR